MPGKLKISGELSRENQGERSNQTALNCLKAAAACFVLSANFSPLPDDVFTFALMPV